MANSPDPEIRIRTAGSSDIGLLARVQLQAALTGFAHIFPDSVAKPTEAALHLEWAPLVGDPTKTVLTAVKAERIIAGVAFGDFPELAPAGCGHVAKLYVLPEAWGSGVGTLLYDMAVNQLQEAGYRELWLWVLEGNARARGMYERRGWVPQTERRTDWPGSGVYEMGYALSLERAIRP